MNLIHRILNVFAAQKAANPPDVSCSRPATGISTPAWLEINALNRASTESGNHLEHMRRARCEEMKRESY